MSEIAGLNRVASGRIANSQRTKIVKSLAYPKLPAPYRRTILQWLASQYTVTVGTPIAIALSYSNTLKTFL